MAKHNKDRANSTNYKSGCRCTQCVEWNKARRRKTDANYRNKNRSTAVFKARQTMKNLISRHGPSKIACTVRFVIEQKISHDFCAVCSKALRTFADKQFDHNHDTGNFRAIACYDCNVNEKTEGLPDVKDPNFDGSNHYLV